MKSTQMQQQAIRGSLGDSLPGIDASLLTGDRSDRTQAARQIRKACLETGFFCIDNFLAQSAAHQELLLQMQRFFDIPDNDVRKMAIDVSEQEHSHGWMPMFGEPAYQPGTIAHLESFDCGRARRAVEGPDWTPNRWPEMPGFRAAVRAVWDELAMIGTESLRAIAEAFEFEREFLVERCNSQDLSTMRLLHYPSHTPAADDKSNVGIAAHTDFECITLISQTAPGLELQDVNGDWYDAPAQADRLVVMPGDMLERWTNGACRATGHRVRTRGWQRYSVVLFFAVNEDITIVPQDKFLTSDRLAGYAPVTQRDHSNAQLMKAEKNRDDAANDQISSPVTGALEHRD